MTDAETEALLREADDEVLHTSEHADWLDQDHRNANESKQFRRAGSVVRRLATALRHSREELNNARELGREDVYCAVISAAHYEPLSGENCDEAIESHRLLYHVTTELFKAEKELCAAREDGETRIDNIIRVLDKMRDRMQAQGDRIGNDSEDWYVKRDAIEDCLSVVNACVLERLPNAAHAARSAVWDCICGYSNNTVICTKCGRARSASE